MPKASNPPAKPQASFGIIGLAVMGQNLALNVASKGFTCAVYNRTAARTKEMVEGPAKGNKRILPSYSLKAFVASIKRPRKIMLMVKAGQPVDDFIKKLVPLLEKGDLIIDGGNSLFKDTIRRNKALEAKGLLYIGTGVSGGEEGALHGPAIMPGGQKKAWTLVKPIFTRIAAQVGNDPCCTYIGPDGAGHYVKMVHNGIEYGDMQLISEAYFIMANALGLSASELHQVFAEWNRGDLDSYLIQITADIFTKVDPDTGNALVEVILDKAGQKGTGAWTSQNALELGVAAPTIAEAVFARCISAIKNERVAASQQLVGPMDVRWEINRAEAIEKIRQALYASKVCSYAQGFALIREAAKEYHWDIRFGDLAMIWRGGCIIRARFLHRIKEAFDRNPALPNLLLDPYFKDIVEKAQASWREVIAAASMMGIPVPAFSSALAYFDSYRRSRLPANLIQAQRDYFGAHTYERVDRPGSFHTEWLKD
ncbi:MAG TPA: NADP-dependent phosphogluconate dehydrogenase [Planctomycetota bacterium]|nr:NADP-dependent phosphogluconate dehydrogenase [Planctomycetota bacterium]HRR83215.1 NADP-dependent phosphogluconate dehydrogenase [Planctomycetota bacterium]HRT97336.1 NADP-dependent phosphogluconate dehydrogenase [Planctomycetota bacterium]